jgi:ATP-binding protein involved in chromosome partitioning
MLGKLLTLFFENVIWDDVDLVLIDLPPGTGDVALDVQGFVPSAKMILVTTPHPNASHVALKAGIGAKEIGHDVIGVVENMSYYFNTCSNTREFIFGQGGGETVAKKLGVPVMGQIPIGQPQKGNYVFTDKDEAGKIYNDIAKVVIKEMEI